jgi:hypothetical protein
VSVDVVNSLFIRPSDRHPKIMIVGFIENQTGLVFFIGSLTGEIVVFG